MTSGVVDPMCGNNPNSIVRSLRQGEDLDVEAPARDCRLRENPFRHFGAKSLESALGVPNSRYGNGLDDKIADLSDDPFVPCLWNQLPCPGRVLRMARGNDEIIVLLEDGDHFVEMGNVRRIVAISEET